MTLTFISNYINHHQMPFCDACFAALGEDFHFVQTEPMEAERRAMGWDGENVPAYVVNAWEDEARARELVISADVALIGWAQREDLVAERMNRNLPTVRVSERLYREGQWKAVSPRGLVHKYREHIRYRQSPFYLLAIGAYTASDFRLIHAYPGKIYRWGYFPPFDAAKTLLTGFDTARRKDRDPVQLLWAGRFLPLKHPEAAMNAAETLHAAGIPFHLTMIGDGELRAALEKRAAESGISDAVTFTGFLSPEETRARMRENHIFLFNSDHLEGWGAVVSEAMGAGCAVIAGTGAGAPPVLIRHGENGLLYRNGDTEELCRQVRTLAEEWATRNKRLFYVTPQIERLGDAAFRTIADLWNAEHAASEFLRFCDCILAGKEFVPPEEGPMSVDPGWKPFVNV
ncbi:MAG: glycosyltransferase family 4 protein [Lachnospiraceae bacterium]|nr:glycosyltransferase family 4 protein [Lachnospiraceae bacterium]